MEGLRADGVRGSSLVVRMVSTVGNYDYLTELQFGADGGMKVYRLHARLRLVRDTFTVPPVEGTHFKAPTFTVTSRSLLECSKSVPHNVFQVLNKGKL